MTEQRTIEQRVKPWFYRGYNIVHTSKGFCVWNNRSPSRLVARDLRTWREAEALIDRLPA